MKFLKDGNENYVYASVNKECSLRIIVSKVETLDEYFIYSVELSGNLDKKFVIDFTSSLNKAMSFYKPEDVVNYVKRALTLEMSNLIYAINLNN
jgi:hypothetical protein